MSGLFWTRFTVGFWSNSCFAFSAFLFLCFLCFLPLCPSFGLLVLPLARVSQPSLTSPSQRCGSSVGSNASSWGHPQSRSWSKGRWARLVRPSTSQNQQLPPMASDHRWESQSQTSVFWFYPADSFFALQPYWFCSWDPCHKNFQHLK